MKYSKSYQSGHNEPVLLASSGAKPNIAKPNIAKTRKQKNNPYGNKKEEFRRENAITGTAGPGADCAHDAGYTGDGMPMNICSSAAPYCMKNEANTQWGKCATTSTLTLDLPPWLVGIQDPSEACLSAGNYCNNGNMQACNWRDRECSSLEAAALALAALGITADATAAAEANEAARTKAEEEAGRGMVREDIVMPPDTDVETFTVKAKEVILTIIRDETMPDWVYETIPAEMREEINSEHGLSLNTAKWAEIFHAMEPTNPEGLLSRGDVSFIIWQRKQIMTIVSYVLRHLKNNEEWIISTMGELMAGNYKSNEYVSLAVEFFTLLGKSVGLEQNSDPNLGTLGSRLTALTADKVTLNETITELQTQLTTQKNELETKLKKAEEDLAMRNKLIIGLAVFIFILIIVLLIK
tara:strand:+ start:14483 stop:15715 length:1233 start_codon:yes stop_codon:yes gene_type:complete